MTNPRPPVPPPLGLTLSSIKCSCVSITALAAGLPPLRLSPRRLRRANGRFPVIHAVKTHTDDHPTQMSDNKADDADRTDEQVLVSLDDSSENIFHRPDEDNPQQSACRTIIRETERIRDLNGRSYTRERGDSVALVSRQFAEAESEYRPCKLCFVISGGRQTRRDILDEIERMLNISISGSGYISNEELAEISDKLTTLYFTEPLYEAGQKPEKLGLSTGESANNTQRDRIKAVKERIKFLADRHESGAPIEDVINSDWYEGGEFANDEEVLRTVKKLRQRGEVYMPTDGYLKVV